jgi:hypothetical protein
MRGKLKEKKEKKSPKKKKEKNVATIAFFHPPSQAQNEKMYNINYIIGV